MVDAVNIIVLVLLAWFDYRYERVPVVLLPVLLVNIVFCRGFFPPLLPVVLLLVITGVLAPCDAYIVLVLGLRYGGVYWALATAVSLGYIIGRRRGKNTLGFLPVFTLVFLPAILLPRLGG